MQYDPAYANDGAKIGNYDNVEQFEKKLNIIYETLEGSSFEESKTILLGHLQRIISDKSGNDFVLANRLISKINGELLLMVTSMCEMRDAQNNKRKMLPPVYLDLVDNPT